jgi:ribose-phosphate pyrophosphokinase
MLMKIFAGSSNFLLAERIASKLGIALSSREIFLFPDGEQRIQIQESVINEDVVLVQSTAFPVDSHYMELFFLADAARRSGARTVSVVMPYMGYQRQDHVFRDGEAVSLQVIIQMLEALGVDRLVTFDLHSIKIPEYFHMPLSHLSALPLFAEQIKKRLWDTPDTCFVSPDMGGIRRVKQLSVLLGTMPSVTIHKERDLTSGALSISQVDGKIKKRALIIDDMISSGKTIVLAAELLKKKGAAEVYVFITHPVFSSDAVTILKNSVIDRIYVTDSIEIPANKRFAKLEILSISGMIAEDLRASSS